MPTPKIDRDRISAAACGLGETKARAMLDAALGLLPPGKLVELARAYLDPSVLAPEGKAKGNLLAAIQAFERASLAGEYYESFRVDSRNYRDTSPGTASWIAECRRLFDRCVARTKAGAPAEVSQAFEILLGLLAHVDEGEDDVVFFADEGGAWQVGVDWEQVMPAWLEVLAATAGPEEFARRVVLVIEQHHGHDRKPMLALARRHATPEQRRALPKS
jgi:hypothetical protein